MAEEKSHLKAVGPIDPSNGFPLWFEDENGLRLELGINRDTLSPDPLTPAICDLPTPGGELSFPDNFPDESFYFIAEAELGDNGVIGRARVILALEAAFGGDGNPGEGLNMAGLLGFNSIARAHSCKFRPLFAFARSESIARRRPQVTVRFTGRSSITTATTSNQRS